MAEKCKEIDFLLLDKLMERNEKAKKFFATLGAVNIGATGWHLHRIHFEELHQIASKEFLNQHL